MAFQLPTMTSPKRPRRQLPTRLHLPDCNSLAFASGATGDEKECDCGKPLGILPHSKTLVKRYSKKRGRVALVVIPKMQLREGEEDLCESRLMFERDSQSWIRQQMRADERKAKGRSKRGADFNDVWKSL